jgi:DNA-binding protein WhiA
MSFSAGVKNEILENRPVRRRFTRGLARGLFAFGRSFGRDKMSIATEHGDIAALYEYLARRLLGRAAVTLREGKRSGRPQYMAEVTEQNDREALLPLLDMPFAEADFSGAEELGAFLGGVFLACGNMSDPEKGYHLEFVIKKQRLSAALAGLLESLLPGAKSTTRRGSFVVYYKECVQIEDLLTLMGAPKASLSLIDIEMIKEVRNKANRVTNCETANIDKTVAASAAQIESIQAIWRERGEASLPDDLREVARLRVENPELSLRELAELMEKPISRSSLHRRLERLTEMGNRLIVVSE